jgi:hypothetical protein
MLCNGNWKDIWNTLKEEIVTALNDALVDILTQVTAGVKQGVMFLQGQLPDVVKQLLQYHLYYNLTVMFLIVVGIAIGSFAELWLIRQYKKGRSYYSDWEAPTFIFGILLAIGAVFGIITFVATLLETLEITLAPKVWLIEYAATLIHK